MRGSIFSKLLHLAFSTPSSKKKTVEIGNGRLDLCEELIAPLELHSYQRSCQQALFPRIDHLHPNSTMIALRTASRTALPSLRRFATTQAGAAVEEAASTARATAKEGLAEAKGAVKQAEGTVKGAAQQAKASIPSPPPKPIVVGSPTIRRPVGSVRGGVLGFLFGFGIASAYGYYYLLKEYNAASNLMLASVEELQGSTEKVSHHPHSERDRRERLINEGLLKQITGHLQRLNKLEADLKSLTSNSASKAEYEKQRVEMKRIVDGIHDEVLDVKKQVLDLPRPTKYMQ